MDYFCYISQTKVDQLLGNLEATQSDTWTESATREGQSEVRLEGGLSIASVLQLFKGEASYGRKGTVQFGREVKRRYLDKLQQILEAIAIDPGIYSLADHLPQPALRQLYYHYVGDFRTERMEDGPQSGPVVTISSTLPDGGTLLLDCSLRYFAESTTPDGKFVLNSSNNRFFGGGIPLRFETVFLLLHRSTSSVVGTPLFLKLHAQDGSNFVVI